MSAIPCILTVNVCALTTVGIMEPVYFSQLHTSDDAAERALAASLTQDEALLRQLVSDEHDHVRIAVAGNPACPPDALELLNGDASLTVRVRAMRGNKASSEIIGCVQRWADDVGANAVYAALAYSDRAAT